MGVENSVGRGERWRRWKVCGVKGVEGRVGRGRVWWMRVGGVVVGYGRAEGGGMRRKGLGG